MLKTKSLVNFSGDEKTQELKPPWKITGGMLCKEKFIFMQGTGKGLTHHLDLFKKIKYSFQNQYFGSSLKMFHS